MSARRLKLADPPAPAPPARTDPITAWLDTLSLVLRLPREQRDGIRAELAGHLKDRVRDLMLTGVPESMATQTALEELGDAVKLAHRLRAATRSPSRRLVMNFSVLAVAGAALVTSVVALRAGGPDSPAPAVMPQPTAKAPEQVEKIKLTAGPGATWADLVKQIGEKAGMPVEARWRTLAEVGYEPGTKLSVEMKDQPLPGLFRFIAEENSQPLNVADYRVVNGRLIIASAAYFDQQETVLVAYDLSKQVAQRAEHQGCSLPEAATAVTNQVRELVQELVNPDGWRENGGSLASTAIFESKLFIKAPKRYHTEIQWVMDQLPKPEQRGDAEVFERTGRFEQRRPVPILRDLPIVSDRFTLSPTHNSARPVVLDLVRPEAQGPADAPTDPSAATPASPPRGH